MNEKERIMIEHYFQLEIERDAYKNRVEDMQNMSENMSCIEKNDVDIIRENGQKQTEIAPSIADIVKMENRESGETISKSVPTSNPAAGIGLFNGQLLQEELSKAMQLVMDEDNEET